MDSLSFVNEVRKQRIIMIYRGLSPEECLEMSEALLPAGIRFFEVTMNTEGALDAIKLLRSRLGPEVHVGAGTVLTAEQVQEVAAAGGTYVISPNVNEDVIRMTKRLGLYSIPGAFTPTEILKAHDAGADLVKVFPINAAGAEYIRQLRGPIQDIPFVATGGVRLDMVKELFRAGADAIGMGVHLLGKEWVESRNGKELQASAGRFMAMAGYGGRGAGKMNLFGLTGKHYSLLIDGEWIAGREQVMVYDKYTGEPMAAAAQADFDMVSRAVGAAKRAFETTRLAPYERYRILKRTSELLLARKQELAELMTGEAGKTIAESLIEIERTALTLEVSAEEAKRVHGETIPVESTPGAENRLAFTIRVPVGVVCAITPFNVPLNLVAHKIGPALAAGNTVVLKPASATPLTAIKLAELLDEAGLPKGYMNIVVGPGATVGQWLAEDERIGLYTFTGSPEIGLKLKRDTGLRKVLLELGSNSAVIVHEDADLDRAVDLCAAKSFANAGQVCISVQRIYVHESIREAFVRKFTEKTLTLKAGNPHDASTQIGPMISEKEAARAEAWVREAVAAGARLECGGSREGALMQPTVLSGVTDDMKVSCEELFAPVVGIAGYTDLDDCIRRINGSRYGLQAGVFTRSLDVAFKAAREIHVGGVMINDASQFPADPMPYGGVKQSGWGKEGPKYAIQEMTEERIIVFNL